MPVKPGVRTTEFWLSVVVILGSAVDALAGSLPDRYAGVAVAVASGLYAVSRGLAKRPAVVATHVNEPPTA
jgi:hypothetical protein